MTGPIAHDPREADANGAWFSPPEHVQHAALRAELDARQEKARLAERARGLDDDTLARALWLTGCGRPITVGWREAIIAEGNRRWANEAS